MYVKNSVAIEVDVMNEYRLLKKYKKIISLVSCICFCSMVFAPAVLAEEQQANSLAEPALTILEPVASGVTVLSNEKAVIYIRLLMWP